MNYIYYSGVINGLFIVEISYGVERYKVVTSYGRSYLEYLTLANLHFGRFQLYSLNTIQSNNTMQIHGHFNLQGFLSLTITSTPFYVFISTLKIIHHNYSGCNLPRLGYDHLKENIPPNQRHNQQLACA